MSQDEYQQVYLPLVADIELTLETSTKIEFDWDSPTKGLTLSQHRSIKSLLRHIREDCAYVRDDYGARVHFLIEKTKCNLVFVTANKIYDGLEPGNFLRAFNREHWFAKIGTKGKVTIHAAPSSYDQFKNKKTASGFFFKL